MSDKSKKLNLELTAIALKSNTRDYQTLAISYSGKMIEYEDILSLKIPEKIDWEKGIILFGKAPIWLYSHLVWRCHKAAWIACFQPGLNAAVIVSSKVKEFQPGDTIPIIFNQNPAPAILICGPPNSGKSVLSNSLRIGLVKTRPNNQIYLHRANWDGEGNHTYENPDPVLARRLAQESKFKIHQHKNADKLLPKYFDYHAETTRNIRQVVDLAIVDVGGKPEVVKMPVVESCSHYIVISNDQSKVTEWHDLCGGKLQPLAVIHSVLEERLEVLKTEPFLEIIAGPWVREKVRDVPEVLLKEVCKL
ncbi:MAG: CRISPR-associated ring nuclease Crn3/Csx3, partial [Microcoleaceae cyanobacterium]